ncbi:MAG: hypothetical protein ACKVGW_10205, partial [Verrucomicrobiia bacterium]
NDMKRIKPLIILSICFFFASCAQVEEKAKSILLLSGTKSHAFGHHECNADISVLENLLQRQVKAEFSTKLYLNGAWPEPSEFETADAIVIICDGDEKHILKDRMAEFDGLLKKNPGVGLFFIHYATVPFGRKEADFKGTSFNNWIGGFYAGDSKNKTLTRYSHIKSKLSDHPVNNGVAPYTLFDEIYYRMEFGDDIKPVVVAESLQDVPSFNSPVERMRFGRDNAQVATFESELERTIFWSYDREDGGKSLGMTMCHIHENFWTNESIRKQMINSVAWISGLAVPSDGYDALDLTEEQLNLNHSLPKAE